MRPRMWPPSPEAPITATERGRNSAARSRRSLSRLISALSEERPDAVRALACRQAAKLQRPGALDAELVAPRPQAPRQLMQAMLVGEPDGAMHLMHDVGDLARGLSDPKLRRARREGEIAGAGCGHRRGDRHARGRHLLRRERQLLLDRLKFSDRTAELHAVPGIGDRKLQGLLQRARHLRGSKPRAPPMNVCTLCG